MAHLNPTVTRNADQNQRVTPLRNQKKTRRIGKAKRAPRKTRRIRRRIKKAVKKIRKKIRRKKRKGLKVIHQVTVYQKSRGQLMSKATEDQVLKSIKSIRIKRLGKISGPRTSKINLLNFLRINNFQLISIILSKV